MSWKIGIDTGGTFTDVAAFDMANRTLRVAKVPSNPQRPDLAVVAGLQSILSERASEIGPADIGFFGHGTTVATNALLELKGMRPGLLLTKGYRGVYEVRGGSRPRAAELIDAFYRKPTPLVRQEFTYEIDERIASDGSVVRPLDEESVMRAAQLLRKQGIGSVAICFLFSFANPSHELRAAEIFRDEYPECRISLSNSVLPVIREYRRISTTLLDAYVGPVVETYLRRLTDHLRDVNLSAKKAYVMQSNGGLMRIDVAANYPNQTLLSGPAAGVVLGAAIGKAAGVAKLITFDMGGTSTDISAIVDGAYAETREGEIGGQDIGTPMMEIRTFGAGGGTIASIGSDGLLKTGPQSAGAYPGPASYDRGGTLPTVTDANVVLGYIGPGSLTGGRMQMKPDLARAAIEREIAKPLDLGVEQAALGIIRVVNVSMEVGLRLALADKGLDPRQFSLVAFGGSGPLHAGRLARNVHIPEVIVPPHPGISCALGLLLTDVKHLYVHSWIGSLMTCALDELNSAIAILEDKARDDAEQEDIDFHEVQLSRHLDLRYPKQGYELTIACPRKITEADRLPIRHAFDSMHREVFGTAAPDEVPEIVNVRLSALTELPKFDPPPISSGSANADKARIGEREALFEEYEAYRPVPVYRRDLLRAGNVIDGPAIVEQFDATTVIYPDQRAEIDAVGNLRIQVEMRKALS